jgi:hypothetical protein
MEVIEYKNPSYQSKRDLLKYTVLGIMRLLLSYP